MEEPAGTYVRGCYQYIVDLVAAVALKMTNRIYRLQINTRVLFYNSSSRSFLHPVLINHLHFHLTVKCEDVISPSPFVHAVFTLSCLGLFLSQMLSTINCFGRHDI